MSKSWKNRPDNRIGDCLETRKILHGMGLSEQQLIRTLLYFFPDLYESDSNALNHTVNNIIYDHASYPEGTEWINKDVLIIENHLKKIGVL